jgi:hypothetical protein
MAISLTLFYGSTNAHNGAAASLGFDCPRKPKIKRDCIKPVSRCSDRSPPTSLPWHHAGPIPRRPFIMRRPKTSKMSMLR